MMCMEDETVHIAKIKKSRQVLDWYRLGIIKSQIHVFFQNISQTTISMKLAMDCPYGLGYKTTFLVSIGDLIKKIANFL